MLNGNLSIDLVIIRFGSSVFYSVSQVYRFKNKQQKENLHISGELIDIRM